MTELEKVKTEIAGLVKGVSEDEQLNRLAELREYIESLMRRLL